MRISISWSSTGPPTFYVCKKSLVSMQQNISRDSCCNGFPFLRKFRLCQGKCFENLLFSHFLFLLCISVKQVVHPGLGHSKGMLVNALLYHFRVPAMWYSRPCKTHSKNRKNLMMTMMMVRVEEASLLCGQPQHQLYGLALCIA